MFTNSDLFKYCLNLFENKLKEYVIESNKIWRGIPNNTYFYFSEFIFRVEIYKIINNCNLELEDKEKEILKVIMSYISIVVENYEQELLEEI